MSEQKDKGWNNLEDALHTQSEIPLTILFDGVCNLCDSAVQWTLLRDKQGIFRFASLQSDYGRELLLRHGLDADNFNTMILVEKNRVYTRSGAALKVLNMLGGWWRLTYPLLWIPRPVRDAVYNFIAKNRYRWFGRRESCMLPRPEWKGRFID